ncbi:YhgE/Pip domain-containing protein [Lentilactobacillus kisonensis]|uniref:YhgE/Pip domain protein n=3 Tax=Lentilactobacillus kisonensis TaxID=481722 RepID=H1LIV6_9LACO|nr:YhgE/Pip domain-containing protein [Lentilactobacillus kisonensis]EHO49486.1 YhgE/Pip domain protein [Lentilactobacillus kisonensis F0435]KRL21421.1 YhgE Pip domain protein [Lentilactobacillus kisonensis DSM 19906 = JCM 15041]
MRTIFTLFKRDLKRIFRSRPVWITLLAFCLLPSIYAIPNIKASWDPYSKANTSRLPIAVVNGDEGSTVNGKSVDIGKQIVTQLKRSKDIHWVITNSWQGNNGLDQGKYYALIEIPNDFSSKLGTLVTTNPQKPNIVYKSNEKLNPAATKITGQAKDSLTEQVRDNFIKISSKAALKEMNSVGEKLDTHKPQILQIRTSLMDAINTIKKTQGYLGNVNHDSKDMQQYLSTVKNDIPKISQQISALQKVVNHGKSLTNATKDSLDSARSGLASGLNELQEDNQRLAALASDLKTSSGSPSSSLLATDLSQSQTLTNMIVNQLNDALRVANVINNILPSNRTVALIRSLSDAKKAIHQQQRTLTALKETSKSGGSKKALDRLTEKFAQTSDQLGTNIDAANTSFTDSIDQSLDNLSSTLTTGMTGDDQVLQSLRSLIPQLKALATAGNSISQISVSRVNQIHNRLNDIQDKLDGLNNQTKFINDQNLNRLINLLGENPKAANLLSSPVTLKQADLYNMGKFGYGVTPFYTTLSIWIGILLLTTIISWKYRSTKNERFPRANMLEKYVGKLLLYLSISLTQTTFTMLGELLILGIRPASVLAMLATAYTATIVFTIIMYTLVYMFGNVGKVISVLLMIIQLFGTGGIYPLETIPPYLAALAPYLPFTYAIQGFREAIAGPIPSIYWHSLMILGSFAILFLLLAPLRRVFQKPIADLEMGFHKSKL